MRITINHYAQMKILITGTVWWWQMTRLWMGTGFLQPPAGTTRGSRCGLVLVNITFVRTTVMVPRQWNDCPSTNEVILGGCISKLIPRIHNEILINEEQNNALISHRIYRFWGFLPYLNCNWSRKHKSKLLGHFIGGFFPSLYCF